MRILVDELMGGTLDVGHVALPALPDRIGTRPLHRECAPGHRFKAMNPVPLREFQGEDYLRRMGVSGAFRGASYPTAHPGSAHRTPQRARGLDSDDAARRHGVLGDAGELLPTLPGIATGLLVDPQVSRGVVLATVGGQGLSPAVARLLALAQCYSCRSGARATLP